MTINQTQIRILNTIIGHIGDVSSDYATAQKICVDLRGMLQTMLKEDPAGVIVASLVGQTGVHPAATFDRVVTLCCRLLGKSRAEIEAAAMDGRFDDVEWQ